MLKNLMNLGKFFFNEQLAMSNNKKIILITGATGFIGSALARFWAKDNELLLLDKNLKALEALQDELNGTPCILPFDFEKAKDEDFLQGVKAEDDVDGDVTSTLSVAGKSNFIEEGVIRVDYAAFDSHNNIGTYSRKVIFDDYHSPRFASKAPLALRSESSYAFSLQS